MEHSKRGCDGKLVIGQHAPIRATRKEKGNSGNPISNSRNTDDEERSTPNHKKEKQSTNEKVKEKENRKEYKRSDYKNKSERWKNGRIVAGWHPVAEFDGFEITALIVCAKRFRCISTTNLTEVTVRLLVDTFITFSFALVISRKPYVSQISYLRKTRTLFSLVRNLKMEGYNFGTFFFWTRRLQPGRPADAWHHRLESSSPSGQDLVE